ncbi:MAG: efflux RND transporter periplasmic adaptor subunit, partial [Daejeonella sp.]
MKTYVIAVMVMLFASACGGEKKQSGQKSAAYYTCSMHPQIMEPQPGKCPICHMDLIAVKKNTPVKAGDLMLTDQQIQLGNIHVDTINSGIIGDEMILTATLNIDQNKTNVVSARVMGRVDKLYFKNIGDFVPRGAKLYDIYSEELNNAQQEYIASIEKKEVLDNSLIDFDRLIQSAKNKLQLWGMSNAQISQLAKSRKFSPNTTFYSTASGYITTTDIVEGSYVEEGGAIVHLADLSTLWAEAQVYSSQLAFIDSKAAASVNFPDIPGRNVRGKIDFENPELSPDSRINLLRVTIPNSDGLLKPGMSAYVHIKGKENNSLTLPTDAVLRDAKGASVWVQVSKNSFKNVMVTVGLENDNSIEIKSGLNAGDVVVTSG